MVRLSLKEVALLTLLINHSGTSISRQQILREVWKVRNGSRETRAVDLTVRRIRTKLERDPADPDHLQTAHGIGYQWVARPRSHPKTASPASPPHFGSMVGRRQELAELTRMLSASQSIGIYGPPGVGKSRLAQDLLASQSEEITTAIVDLSSCRTMDDLLRALCFATGASGDPWTSLPPRLRSVLVLLDNADLCIDSIVQFLQQGRSISGARFVVTARSRIPGPVVFELQPLTIDESLIMFRQRATAAGGDLSHTPDGVLRALMATLDGLPLAIELAADRTRVLSPTQILSNITDRFRLLRHPSGTDSRHTAMSTNLELSWSDLSPLEQDALVLTTCFRGSFSLHAAVSVAQGEGGWLPDTLLSLQQKSLLGLARDSASDSARFRALHSVREFAESKAPRDLLLQFRRQHVRMFADNARQFTPSTLARSPGLVARGMLDLENFTHAFHIACNECDPITAEHLLVCLYVLNTRAGRQQEARKHVDLFLGQSALTEIVRSRWLIRVRGRRK